MSVELQADTCNEAVFAINDYQGNWNWNREVKFSNIPSGTWTTYSWSFPIPLTQNIVFHLGVIPTGSSLTQAAGDLMLKNLHLYTTSALSTIDSAFSCTKDISCLHTVSAMGFTSTSDESIKENVQNASVDECTKIFQSVDVRTYVRNDTPGQRIGFIAQEIQQSIPAEFGNIVGAQYGGNMPLLSLDYSRLVCVLWGACKKQKTQIDDLTARMAVMEAQLFPST
jgi:hypothetical protein